MTNVANSITVGWEIAYSPGPHTFIVDLSQNITHKVNTTCMGWHPYQSCHEKFRFDVSFSDPPTQVRNFTPWKKLADKVNQ